MFRNWPGERRDETTHLVTTQAGHLSPDDLYDGGGEGEAEHDVDGAEQHVDGPV